MAGLKGALYESNCNELPQAGTAHKKVSHTMYARRVVLCTV